MKSASQKTGKVQYEHLLSSCPKLYQTPPLNRKSVPSRKRHSVNLVMQSSSPFAASRSGSGNPKFGSRGRIFLTQRRREAENAEKIANLQFYRSAPDDKLFHPLGDDLLQVNLMHGSLYSQDSEHSLRSRSLCVSA